MNKIDKIILKLKTLTLLEAVTLVEKIEKIFGVSASNGQNIGIPVTISGPSEIEEIEEKTEFDLILIEVPIAKKIAILKVVRNIAGLGLKESKTLVEAVPQKVKGSMTKDAAEIAKKQLEEAGAKVEIK